MYELGSDVSHSEIMFTLNMASELVVKDQDLYIFSAYIQWNHYRILAYFIGRTLGFIKS